MSELFAWCLIIFVTCIYLLPSLLAKEREHPYLIPIVLVNLLLGWTYLGWVIALVWAFINPKTQK